MAAIRYVFVHGLSGWGSYDKRYKTIPYWGMRNGDLTQALRRDGYSCYAASVSPTGSAWDRACELYAQLTGTRTDYGKAHSEKMRHERFGKDFSSCPLIEDLGEEDRFVFIGHSFGGATVRLFSELYAHGDAAEREETPEEELSPFFAGGFGGRILAIAALASPMNGTTAYDLFEDPSFDPESVRFPFWSRFFAMLMGKAADPKTDGRDPSDYADFDMHLDQAMKLNERMPALPDVYYFSVPCSITRKNPDGCFVPIRKRTEPLFIKCSYQMGAYKGKTKGGFTVDESWRENDGLVNTVSAKFPIGERNTPFDRENIAPGIWNVFPVYDGDHMSIQGGASKKHPVLEFYRDLLSVIGKLA